MRKKDLEFYNQQLAIKDKANIPEKEKNIYIIREEYARLKLREILLLQEIDS